MCCSQVFKDLRSWYCNAPAGALEREVLQARLRKYWVRVQYICWNVLATVFVYIFRDSMLNVYLDEHRYSPVIMFHSIQLVAIIAYFIASFRDPGFIQKGKYTEFMMDFLNEQHDDELPAHSVIDTKTEQEAVFDENDYKYLDMNVRFEFNHTKEAEENDATAEKPEHFPYEVVRYVPDYSRDIKIDPDTAPSNFCWRCKFIRPIRSKHCYDCDRCVAKFDHHCPMVGNCVAANNHRFFVLFMTAQTIVVLWAFYISLETLFRMNTNFNYNNDAYSEEGEGQIVQATESESEPMQMDRSPLGWFLRIIFFVALFFAVFVTVGLCGYHVYLGVTNQTTYEMIKPQIVESYLKDELNRKRRFIRKQQKRKLKQLKKAKAKQLEQHQELSEKQRELQQQMQVLDQVALDSDNNHNADDEEDDAEEHKDDDEKYNDEDSDSSVSSEEDDASSFSEKVLLFSQEPDQDRESPKVKREQTPKQGAGGLRIKSKSRKRKAMTTNYTNVYSNYFDEGFGTNLYILLTGKMHPEWITPLPCSVVSKRNKK
mmetsp:Transcript_17796/g.28430  ORF Transcript_17796/g.28430 Transcript_17796/m.28430 type:complete len:541 (+) Transcript_17796:23-1645(+)